MKSNGKTIIRSLLVISVTVYGAALIQNDIATGMAIVIFAVAAFHIGKEIYKDLKSQFNNAWPVDLAAVKFITWASTI